jgi:pyruvate kinase
LAIGYQPGDLVAIVGGSPPTTEDCTNFIRIHRLGEEDFR